MTTMDHRRTAGVRRAAPKTWILGSSPRMTVGDVASVPNNKTVMLGLDPSIHDFLPSRW